MKRLGGRGIRGWWPSVLATAVLLACGASAHYKPLPAATLAPGIAPFEVVTLGTEELQARDGRDGRLLWQEPMVSANAGVLLAADGIVFHRAQVSEAVEAYEAESGVLRWRLSECPGYDDTLTAAGALLLVTCGANVPSTPQTVAGDTLYALDAATGTVRWQAHGEHFRAVAGDLVITQTPSGLAARTLAEGLARWSLALPLAPQVPPNLGDPLSSAFDIAIIAANGMLYLSPDGQYLVAVRASDGSVRWQSVAFAHLANAPMMLGRLTPRFVVAAATTHTVIARTDSSAGYGVVALDAESGAVRWHVENDTPGSYLSSLVGPEATVFADDYVHANESSMTLRRLDPDSGAVLWRVQDMSLSTRPVWYVADTLYIGGGPQFLALRGDDGTQLFDDQGFIPTELAADAEVVCVASTTITNSRDLYLLSALDGKQIWEAKGAGDLRAAPIIITMNG